LTKELAESFGLSLPDGALVSSVEKGGPADKAGIEASDVILKFDGHVVNNSSDLPRIVAATRPGSRVTVDLWRKGAAKQVTLAVAKMAEDGKPGRIAKGLPDESGKLIVRLGMVLSEPDREQGNQGGLLVQDVKGLAARSVGLQRGDVLLAIGNIPLRSVSQLEQIISQVPKGRNVALLVRRAEVATYVAIRLDDK
jgi:serine protease Do